MLASLSLLAAPTAVLAHHGLEGQFNTQKTITLTGTVSRLDWSNPHVRLYLDVKDDSKTVTWELNMGSPNRQMMSGWKIDTYKHGDRVKVEANPARDGSNVAYARKVTRTFEH